MQPGPTDMLLARYEPQPLDGSAAQHELMTPTVAWADRSIFEVMWLARWSLVAMCMLGLILGVLLWCVSPSQYEASARLYIERPPSNGQPDPFRSDGATSASSAAQEAVMFSHAVLTAVLERPGIAQGPTLSREQDPIEFLRKNLKLSTAEDKATFTVRFKARDPQEAADVVNAVVAEYVEAQRRRAGTGLSKASTPQKEVLAGESIVAATDDVFSTAVGPRVMAARLTEQELAKLNTELIDAQLQHHAAHARLGAALDADLDFDRLLQITMQANSELQADQTAIVRIRELEQGLTTTQSRLLAVSDYFGPEHRMRRYYENEIALVQQQITEAKAQAATNLLNTIVQDADHADARLAQLQGRAKAAQAASQQLNKLAVEVLDDSVAPLKPSSPKLPIFAAAGAMLGAMFATGLALLGEVRRVAERSEQLGLAGIGLRPAVIAADADSTRLTGWDRPVVAQPGPTLLGSIPRIAASHRLVGPEYDRAADSIHQLRAVLSAMARQNEIQSIAFVSTQRRVGRTSVTIGLASSLSMAGTSVLAVDGDLAGRLARRRAVAAASNDSKPTSQSLDHDDADAGLLTIAEKGGHFRNGTNDKPSGHKPKDTQPPGIAGYLDGMPLQDCVKPASNGQLAFLPASTVEDRHIGAFSDKRMAELIDEAREHFDLILFDSGPIPGSLEAMSIASVVDGVVIIVDERQDTAEYQRTMQHLRLINARILGVVVNQTRQNENTAASENVPPSNHRTHAENPGPKRPRPKHQDEAPKDGPEFAEAGSAILALSVFTDARAGYHESDWELTAAKSFMPDDVEDLPDLSDPKKE
jgi:Mrp family chromosome partitioning ATPase/uncharacterized protein involved in exopolysaccharide biosynthesis